LQAIKETRKPVGAQAMEELVGVGKPVDAQDVRQLVDVENSITDINKPLLSFSA